MVKAVIKEKTKGKVKDKSVKDDIKEAKTEAPAALSVPAFRKLNPALLKRSKPAADDDIDETVEPKPISNGPIDKVIEYTFNASQEKIREVTIIDRLQGRLFPLLDTVNEAWQHCIEIASYRQDRVAFAKTYKRRQPISVNLTDVLVYRIAQWQKSVGGKNMEQAVNIALAEMETKGGEDDGLGGGSNDPFDK